ncbi:lectin BRA-3-like [Amphibalanus amphitrite]|uniref:lectin BRA-3-like n=1 Tax=Amphibalanus amphitrite TaxID=1232801 RepID=UPI001C8FBBC8|nr:lectin BRA-3-like [Amphibalanus amphitrite]
MRFSSGTLVVACVAAAVLCPSAASPAIGLGSDPGVTLQVTGLREIIAEVVAAALDQHDSTHEPQGCRNSCPGNFIPCAGQCYSRLSTQVDHAQAERDCTALHAHLAVPRSRTENLCVAGLAGHENIWLGITDSAEEGVFRGPGGRAVTISDGYVWASGQPDNWRDQEDCVEIRKVSEGYRFAEWNDDNCVATKKLPMCQLL